MLPFNSLGMLSYSHSIVTMALACIVSKIKRYTSRKSQFFSHLLHSTPLLGGSRGSITIQFGAKKLQWCGCLMVKKSEDMFSHFDTIMACDRQTDGQTSCDSIVRAMHRIAQ